MTNLCFQIDGYVSPFADQLPKVQTEDLIYIEKYEEDAYGHWIFGGNSGSLIDKVNSKALTLAPSATINPTFSETGVTISVAHGNCLLSDLPDSATQNLTMCAVVKCNTTALSILLGNLPDSFNTTVSGVSVFMSANKPYLTVKPTTAQASGNGIQSLTVPNDINQTQNFFIALSLDKTTKRGIIYVNQQNIELSNQSTFSASAYVSSNNELSIGNRAYTASNTASNTASFAEAIIFDKALSLSEMKAVANRAKTRQTKRGNAF